MLPFCVFLRDRKQQKNLLGDPFKKKKNLCFTSAIACTWGWGAAYPQAAKRGVNLPKRDFREFANAGGRED